MKNNNVPSLDMSNLRDRHAIKVAIKPTPLSAMNMVLRCASFGTFENECRNWSTFELRSLRRLLKVFLTWVDMELEAKEIAREQEVA